MKVNREELLQCLDSVTPGISPREVIEQSSCFVFKSKIVQTFNEEISCSKESPVKLKGAVQAAPLLSILKKLDEEFIDLEIEGGELIVKGKGRRSGIRMEHEIVLPVDNVDTPKKWKDLNEDFAEGVHIAAQCAGKDDSQFSLTCVNIHPEWVEACDNYQMTRYPVKTGVKKPTLVRRNSLKHITNLGMTEFSETENWLHFRNPAGLVLSCRRYVEDFPDLANLLEVKGDKITLPKGLEAAADKAEVFSSESMDNNQLHIDLKPGKLKVRGEGNSGWYTENKKTNYKGKNISFTIAPKMLQEIVKRYNDAVITEGRLMVDGGKFTYVTCLGAVSE